VDFKDMEKRKAFLDDHKDQIVNQTSDVRRAIAARHLRTTAMPERRPSPE
jgi:hypothetical protein